MGSWVEPALRFAHYALLLGLLGSTAFRLVGLRGIDPVSLDRANGALIVAAVAAPLVSMALMLVSIAAMMGAPVRTLDRPMIEAIISSTDMGTAFLVRITLLSAGLCVLLVRRQTKAALPTAAILFGVALMTLGWSGHAAATEGTTGLFHRLNNGVHLLGAGLWLGAIGWFLRLTGKVHRQPDRVAAQVLLTAMHRFAPLGGTLVATIALTGLVNSQLIFGLEASATVLTTDYGLLLVAKIVLVGGMLSYGARNADLVRRVARTGDGEEIDTDIVLAALRRNLAGEFLVAATVIGLVAVLGMFSPMPM
jgi:copper resistance protein D